MTVASKIATRNAPHSEDYVPPVEAKWAMIAATDAHTPKDGPPDGDPHAIKTDSVFIATQEDVPPRCCYVCNRAFPTEEDRVAHIGLHPGRTWPEYRDAAAAAVKVLERLDRDWRPDVPVIEGAGTDRNSWAETSRSADERVKLQILIEEVDFAGDVRYRQDNISDRIALRLHQQDTAASVLAVQRQRDWDTRHAAGLTKEILVRDDEENRIVGVREDPNELVPQEVATRRVLSDRKATLPEQPEERDEVTPEERNAFDNANASATGSRPGQMAHIAVAKADGSVEVEAVSTPGVTPQDRSGAVMHEAVSANDGKISAPEKRHDPVRGSATASLTVEETPDLRIPGGPADDTDSAKAPADGDPSGPGTSEDRWVNPDGAGKTDPTNVVAGDPDNDPTGERHGKSGESATGEGEGKEADEQPK